MNTKDEIMKTNNNNNNDNDNNNNNNKELYDKQNEILFWRVFHNKYLVYLIFKEIHTFEWNKYNDPEQIHAYSRARFCDISSLYWCIYAKQLKLLKYKIESGEYIRISLDAIDFFFNSFPKQSSLSENSIITTTSTSTTPLQSSPSTSPQLSSSPSSTSTSTSSPQQLSPTKIKELYNNNEILKEILILLLDKHKSAFEICDLTRSAIDCNNIQAFNILTSEPYSIVVYPSTLELAISKCHPILVDLILTQNEKRIDETTKIKITNEIQSNSISNALKNKTYFQEMIKYIVVGNKFALFKKPMDPSCPTIIPQIEIDTFLSIQCILTKNILFESGQVKIPPNFSVVDHFQMNQSLQELTLLFRIYFKSQRKMPPTPQFLNQLNQIMVMNDKLEDGVTVNLEKLKQLQQFILTDKSTALNKPYKEYILKYKESIHQRHPILLSLDQNQNNLQNLSRFISPDNIKISTFGLHEKSISDVKGWYPVFDCIDSQGILTIKDTEIIDWIYENKKNQLITTFFSNYSKSIKFQSLNLLKYSISKIKELLKLEHSSKHPFINAIKSFNIKELKELDSLKIKVIELDDFKFLELNNNNNGQVQEFIELLNYLNDSGYKSFNINNFEKFIKQVMIMGSTSPLLSNQKLPTTNLAEFSFAYNVVHLQFIDSIFKFDYQMVEIYLGWLIKYENPFNLLLLEVPKFNQANRYIFSNGFPRIYHHPIEKGQDSNVVINQIIGIITTLVENFKNFSLESGELLVNWFFEKLISIKSIEMKQVLQVYSLIETNSIQIQHTLYHSFYYLYIRDVKFTRYILKSWITKIIEESSDETKTVNYYDCSFEYINPRRYNIKHYLLPELFTFQYIFGGIQGENGIYKFNTPFGTVISLLIHHLSHVAIEACSGFYFDLFIETFNFDLEYLLDLRRVDLFFKELEYIKLQIDKTSDPKYIPDDSFPFLTYSHFSPSTTIKNRDIIIGVDQDADVPKLPQSANRLLKHLTKLNKPLHYQVPLVVNCFKFSKNVIGLITKLVDPQLIQQFIEFNFHQFGFQSLFISEMILASKHRTDKIKFILDNYQIPFFDINLFQLHLAFNFYSSTSFLLADYYQHIGSPVHFKFNRIKYEMSIFKSIFLDLISYSFKLFENRSTYQQFLMEQTRSSTIKPLMDKIYLANQNSEYYYRGTNDNDNVEKYDLKNYKQEIVGCSIMDKSNADDQLDDEDNLHPINLELLLEIYYQDQTQSQFKQWFDQLEKKIQLDQLEYESDYLNRDDNLFNQYFVYGDISVVNMILHYYAHLKFNLTCSTITKTIEKQNIHIIKYYYNQFIKSNQSLKNHLEMELLNHQNYKFDLNWLN